MTREQLRRSTREIQKQNAEQNKKFEESKLPPPKNDNKIETLDDVIMILYNEDIKSKKVREIKAKKELIDYLQLKYTS